LCFMLFGMHINYEFQYEGLIKTRDRLQKYELHDQYWLNSGVESVCT
jgi:hypothetical protein